MRRILLTSALIFSVTQPIIRVLSYSYKSYPNNAHMVDSLLVLGTAQYDGRPSQQFEARLRHTALMWKQQKSQKVFTVGGKLPGDRFTEAEVAREYLIREGVTSELIVSSPVGNDTVSSFAALAAEDMGRVVIVTDPNHSYRAVRIARRMGIHAHPSPTPFSPAKFPSKSYFLTLMHEFGGVVVQDVSCIFGVKMADKVEEKLRTIQGLLRPSRRARHEHLRRLKK